MTVHVIETRNDATRAIVIESRQEFFMDVALRVQIDVEGVRREIVDAIAWRLRDAVNTALNDFNSRGEAST